MPQVKIKLSLLNLSANFGNLSLFVLFKTIWNDLIDKTFSKHIYWYVRWINMARDCNLHTSMCEDIICGWWYYKGSDGKARGRAYCYSRTIVTCLSSRGVASTLNGVQRARRARSGVFISSHTVIAATNRMPPTVCTVVKHTCANLLIVSLLF